MFNSNKYFIMPKAENKHNESEEDIIHSVKNQTIEEYHSDETSIDMGQRHGLSEGERAISGQKRICYCYGRICAWCEHRFMPFCLVIIYIIVYLIGYYSGFISNCLCSGSDL